MHFALFCALGLFASLELVTAQFGQLALPQLEQISLPPGFQIDLYAEQLVPGARHMALGLALDNTTIVYVSSNSLGAVSCAVPLRVHTHNMLKGFCLNIILTQGLI